MSKIRLATVWLDGCSGCHMSLLDMDERLAELAGRVEFLYTPLVDHKQFPPEVDVTLIEGAVSTEHDEKTVRMIRERTRAVISFGDCAVTANVPGMRNRFKADDVLKAGYLDDAFYHPQVPGSGVPHLLTRARPVHEFVEVDLFLPGCPPPPDAIVSVLTELLEGRTPVLSGRTRFGA